MKLEGEQEGEGGEKQGEERKGRLTCVLSAHVSLCLSTN